MRKEYVRDPYQPIIIDTPEVLNEPRHDPLHLLE